MLSAALQGYCTLTGTLYHSAKIVQIVFLYSKSRDFKVNVQVYMFIHKFYFFYSLVSLATVKFGSFIVFSLRALTLTSASSHNLGVASVPKGCLCNKGVTCITNCLSLQGDSFHTCKLV